MNYLLTLKYKLEDLLESKEIQLEHEPENEQYLKGYIDALKLMISSIESDLSIYLAKGY